MNSETSTVRIRNKEVPSKHVGITQNASLELKSRAERKRQFSNDTFICSLVILVCLTVIISRSNIVSPRVFTGFTVIITAKETKS